jgi:hypothetical protein
MGVNGERHAPAAISPPPPGKTPVPIGHEAGLASELAWTQRLEKNPLPLPGIEPRSSSLWSDATEKILRLYGDWTPIVQSVVRHYTD